jgi:cobalt-zinc-cadmium efflux system membrane fusion protein
MTGIQHKIVFALILTLVISCGNKTDEKTMVDESDDRIKLSKAQFENNAMSFTQLEMKNFPNTIKVNGVIHVPPENKADINSPMGGYVKKAPLLEGDLVKKGAFLITLENPDYVSLQQSYLETKAQLNYQEAEFERHKIMRDENVISQKSFIKVQSDYKAIKAKYNGLKKQLQMLNINIAAVESGRLSTTVDLYAPISGSITKVNVNLGSYVSPATTILEIVNTDHIHLELSVYEKDILSIKKGQKINFTIPEASDEQYKGEVYLVGTILEENRTIRVHGHLLDNEINFLPGMFINAEIITDTSLARAILSSAIVEENSRQFVLVLDEETADDYYFVKTEVSISKVYNDYAEFNEASTLNEKDRILNDGAFGLIGI